MFTLAYEWNEMEYVGMKEADSVIANEDSLVEVPSFDPSILGCLDVKCMCHGIWMNDIKEVICYM